jgi:AraC-like DNA-binding protein
VRVNTEASTYIVPPSRAVWIPPGLVHAVTAIERADLRTLYLGPELLDGEAWAQGRVLEVSPLLRELVAALPGDPDPVPLEAPDDAARRVGIERLVLAELKRARPLALGVALPQDARLRRLCEAMLREPGRHAGLDEWAAEAGYSPRTLSRLFREQLGTSFAQWRSQLLLAHALTLAARGRPMSHIATELGYASASAFTAMVTRTVGMPPSRFFAEA